MTERERGISAIAAKHGAEATDVEKVVERLASLLDAPTGHVITALQDTPRAPSFIAFDPSLSWWERILAWWGWCDDRDGQRAVYERVLGRPLDALIRDERKSGSGK